MKKLIFSTDNSYSPFVLRIFFGVVLFAHGAQKLLGWFGGFGYEGTMGFFTNVIGLPTIIAFLIILIEFFGALLLILGFGTRILSACFLLLSVGIITTVHIEHGFFMNWMGDQKGEGIEYFLFWIGITVSLGITGGGIYSIDKIILEN